LTNPNRKLYKEERDWGEGATKDYCKKIIATKVSVEVQTLKKRDFILQNF
jgi:hypothetical protein